MTKKIFATGLSRTGTKSLWNALEVLGYRALHYPGYAFVDGAIEIDAKALDEYDALLDTPIALAFEDLDAAHPGSKFIHTVRDIDAWLESCRAFFFEGAFQKPRVIELCRRLYGTHVFDEDTFRRAYARHDSRVREHFAGREDDLLVLDVCAGEGWGKVCPFLDRPIIDRAFPRR